MVEEWDVTWNSKYVDIMWNSTLRIYYNRIGFLVSVFAPRNKKSIIDCSLGQFTEDAGRSLDGDLWRRSLDFIDVLCASFLEDLEARFDV